ncbi:MAG: HupE/UreJ family protein [Pseudomonadota bacterium]
MKRWLILFSLLLSSAAQAHKPSDSYLQLRVADSQISGEWDIALRDLEYAIGLDTNGDGNITWAEVRQHRDEIVAFALRGLQIQSESECSFQIHDLQITDHTDGAYAALMLAGRCAIAPKEINIQYDLLFGIDPTHRGLLNLDFGGVQTVVFSPDRRKIDFIFGGSSAAATFWQYLQEGVWHVWTGWDHMLFLAGLMLPSVLRRTPSGWVPAQSLKLAVWDTFRIVTAFTIAHACTLSLAAMGVISLPSRLVESLVAATVVFAGVNNLIPMAQRGLWVLAFFFGLIHGTAIAGALLELGLPPSQRVLALLAFNLGVEGAQLALVSLVVPISFVFRHSTLYRRAVILPSSVVIAVIGMIWLIQRAFAIHLITLGG